MIFGGVISEIKTDVEEVVWSGNSIGVATTLGGSNNPDPSFPKGDGIKVSTQTGGFVSVLSSMGSGSQQASKDATYGNTPPNESLI
ncbi:hypothetical protein Tco_1306928, partial [Tanacetum coccineum]